MTYENLDGIKARIKSEALIHNMRRAGYKLEHPIKLRGKLAPTAWVRDNMAQDRIGVVAFPKDDGTAYVLLDNGYLLPGNFKLNEDGTFVLS